MYGGDPIARAFELARAGEHESVADVVKALHHEGLNTSVITGPTLLAQLRSLIAEARAKAA